MSPVSRRTVLLATATMMTAPAARAAPSAQATLYKEPNCECCEGYANYLRDNQISVDVVTDTNLAERSRAAGIPDDLEGCHITSLNGYVVAGHVPIEAVHRLLSDRPPLKAITLPGMPAGSPGMSGSPEGKLIVYAIPADGSAPVVFNF